MCIIDVYHKVYKNDEHPTVDYLRIETQTILFSPQLNSDQIYSGLFWVANKKTGHLRGE